MKEFRGRGLMGGNAAGEAIVSKKAFTFAHGVDPSTGTVTDVRSDLRGLNVRGKVLVYPHGKGSTTASSWFLETVRLGNAPSALITSTLDLSSVIGSVMSNQIYGKGIPVLCSLPRAFYSTVKTGDHLQVDGKGSRVKISD